MNTGCRWGAHVTWPSAQEPCQPGLDGTLPAAPQDPSVMTSPSCPRAKEKTQIQAGTHCSDSVAREEQNSEACVSSLCPWPTCPQDHSGPLSHPAAAPP